MEAKAAGSVFWAFFLVLFPVAAQLASSGCVTYKHTQICGIKGSSVEFPCSYPNKLFILMSGWTKKLPDMNATILKQIKSQSLQMKYFEHGNNNCTMQLVDLKEHDASVYYFVYSFRTVKGHHKTCYGFPGVRLHVYSSPVGILVENLVKGMNVSIADWTVREGQRIRLTCVLTCAANVNSNPGYIWYKNRLQLNGSRENSPFLSLDPISYKDAGRYVCVLIGYKNLPSSPINLGVERGRRESREIKMSDGGSKMNSTLTLTHDCDAQNYTAQMFNNCQTPTGKGIFTFSIMLAGSVCVGLVSVTIYNIILFLKVEKKKRGRRRNCAGSVHMPPKPNCDLYIALDINSTSAEYTTLDTGRRCSAADTIYENFVKPEKSMG